MSNLNNIKSTNESQNQPSKTAKFVENTKKAVRDTLMKTWIGVSSMMPTATTTTPSVIPASVNTITAMAPIASTAVKTIGLGTAASLFSACGGSEDEPDGPINPEKPTEKDTVAPTIEVSKSEIDITGGKEIKVNGNQLYIGSEMVASRSDNKTKNCNVELSLNGKAISSGTTVSEEGTLSIKVSDEAKNSKTANIKLDVTKNAPSITVNAYEINTSGSKQISINENKLLFGEDIIASRNDDNLESCKVTLNFEGQEVKSGYTVEDSGTLTITITNKNDKSSTADIKFNVIKNAPSITVNQQEINIFGGVKVKINNNKLLLGEDIIASRDDDNLESCKISLSFNGKEIKSGDTINEAGKLMITVTNKNNKTSTAEITVTNNSINGIENLKNASMQVDREINLLNGITFADGIELVKIEIEIDGEKAEISDPQHYKPEYPGTCNIIFTIKGKNGNTAEVKVDNLYIKPLDYKEISMDNANMIQEKYPRYNNLQQTTKDFIYPHLIASYAACNRSKQDNRVHIIQGETTNASDVENIGQWNDRSDHAYQGYYRIRALSPDVSIKGCDDYWNNLEEYINHHPDKIYIISCAAGSAGGRDREEYNRNPETSSQKSLLENENVIIICSGGNRGPSGRKTYNESIKNGDYYTASATNSKKNNKITVTGYNSWGGDNYFSPDYIEYGGLRSAMPIGYDKNKGNIVMPMIPLIRQNNQEDQNTTSSFPTAVTSGVIGNAISVIMSNHPGITAEDAMTIIVNNYLKKEKFQYKDETTNWELVDGDYRYFIDIQKLLKSELLQSDKIDKVQFNSDLVELPSSNGICYTGKGIQFEYEGKKYMTTEANQSILNQALKSGKVKWYWDKTAFKKCGGKDSAKFDAYIVDKTGKRIPDLHLQINKPIN